jgi:hypothetical protein
MNPTQSITQFITDFSFDQIPEKSGNHGGQLGKAPA